MCFQTSSFCFLFLGVGWPNSASALSAEGSDDIKTRDIELLGFIGGALLILMVLKGMV